jgi:hypothetical protein
VGGGCGVSADEYSSAHGAHFWRSNSIFNLHVCTGSVQMRNKAGLEADKHWLLVTVDVILPFLEHLFYF